MLQPVGEVMVGNAKIRKQEQSICLHTYQSSVCLYFIVALLRELDMFTAIGGSASVSHCESSSFNT